MDFQKCKFCSKPAKYNCSCVTPYIHFCRDHRDSHEYSPGIHIIKLHKASVLIPNSQTKSVLIEKISQIRHEAKKKAGEVLNRLNILMSRTQEKFDSVLDKLNQFVNTCNIVIEEIDLIQSIPDKLIYCPLELLLLSSDASEIIACIKPPAVVFNQKNGFPHYTPSVFPHFLYNFSDISISLQNIGEIKVYPSNKTINQPLIKGGIQFLNIGNKRLLCTGNASQFDDLSTKCFILNLENNEIAEFPSLLHARTFNAMTWLERNPCVIGGHDGTNTMRSVEMFTNDNWIEMPAINIPRGSHSSVCTGHITWIVGGRDDDNVLDSIEKYENGSWSVLKLSLPIPRGFIGLCSLENNLLLFGGVQSDSDISNSRLLIETTCLRVVELNQINIPVLFIHELFLVDSEQIFTVGYDIEREPVLIKFLVSDCYKEGKE